VTVPLGSVLGPDADLRHRANVARLGGEDTHTHRERGGGERGREGERELVDGENSFETLLRNVEFFERSVTNLELSND
jgi:hypothetical protein